MNRGELVRTLTYYFLYHHFWKRSNILKTKLRRIIIRIIKKKVLKYKLLTGVSYYLIYSYLHTQYLYFLQYRSKPWLSTFNIDLRFLAFEKYVTNFIIFFYLHKCFKLINFFLRKEKTSRWIKSIDSLIRDVLHFGLIS